MKRIYTLFAFIPITVLTLSCAARQALYSPFTMRLMARVEAAETSAAADNTDFMLTEADCRKFLIRKTDSAYLVNGMVTAGQEFDQTRLSQLGIVIRSQQESRFNLTIPVTRLDDLGKIPHVIRIEIDSPVKNK